MRERKVQLVGLLTLCVSWTLLVPHLSRPLWYDEALTIIEFVTLPSFLEIFSYYPIPNNHIGFNVLLRFWTLALESWFQDPIFYFVCCLLSYPDVLLSQYGVCGIVRSVFGLPFSE